jgi:plasmid maintenance system killer protein
MNEIRGIVSVGGRVVAPAPIEKRGLKGNGIDHITLNADYTLSIYYTNGEVETTDPIRGAEGPRGIGIVDIKYNGDYTITIEWEDGQTVTTGSLRGQKGETGNGIESIEKTGTSGLVDTYTITFTDGSTTTFNVTNGSNDWDDITNKPETFPPSAHDHDGVYVKPTDYTPITNAEIDVMFE